MLPCKCLQFAVRCFIGGFKRAQKDGTAVIHAADFEHKCCGLHFIIVFTAQNKFRTRSGGNIAVTRSIYGDFGINIGFSRFVNNGCTEYFVPVTDRILSKSIKHNTASDLIKHFKIKCFKLFGVN